RPRHPSVPKKTATGRLTAFSAGLGFVWYLFLGGGLTLDPTNLEWIKGDLAQHMLGWLFFRDEPLRLPLGSISDLLYPIGTTVGFTDANPWVSLALRPISPWLPDDFQFIGWWMLSSFVLQGALGFKIMETLTPNPAWRVLGAAIFIVSPVLVRRMGHDTLTAHWMLLGLIWLHLRPRSSHRNTLAWAWSFNFIAAGVHPYLAIMVLVLTVSLLARLLLESPRLAPRAAALAGTAFTGQTLAVFALLGYLGSGATLSGGGFGTFSTDLLAFVNKMAGAGLLPALPFTPAQHEGYGYLGAGMIALVVLLVVAAVRRRAMPVIPGPLWPIVVLAGVMFGFALSDHITAAGELIMTMRGFYSPLEFIVAPLRSSGRFVWPLYYLVMTGILALAVGGRFLRPALVAPVLVAVVALQAYAIRQIVYFVEHGWRRMESPAWSGLDPSYRHVVMYPGFYPVGPPECQPSAEPFPYDDFLRIAYLAYRKGMTISSGYVARAPIDDMRAACEALDRTISAGQFASGTVYVVTRGAIEPFLRDGANATCGVLDGLRICVANTTRTRFHQRLQEESEANR
ncbi:MAG TPA: DUF6311 domain-containing protein, partial [Vicinamibacterales bacterium]|nr:DUF6311 domain-containing protein [Vicinamibacterales bacterium]